MKKYFAIAALIAVPFLGSCGMLPIEPPIDPNDPPGHDSTQANVLAGSSWMLSSYETTLEGTLIERRVGPETGYILEFGNAGQLSGQAACNAYSGRYKAQDAALFVNEVASTDMLCSEEDAQLSKLYFETLGGAQAFTQQEGKLTIYAQNGSALHFTELQTMGR